MTQSTSQPPTGRKSKKPEVLVLDDVNVVTLMVRDFLAPHGAVIHPLTSAAKALELFRQRKLSCLFVDLLMSPIDGFEFVTQVREMEGHHTMTASYIIGMTGMNYPTMRQRCFDSGMNDYLAKPLSAANVKEAYERFLAYRERQIVGLA